MQKMPLLIIINQSAVFFPDMSVLSQWTNLQSGHGSRVGIYDFNSIDYISPTLISIMHD